MLTDPAFTKVDTGVLATDVIGINSSLYLVQYVASCHVYHNVLRIIFYHSFTVSEATMGVEASKLVAIDMLKGLCGGGDKIPLTEDDCFNENGVIDDEKFEEYLMQEDIADEAKGKLLVALANMVGSSERKRKRDTLEDLQRRISAGKKKTRVAHPRYYTDPVTGVRRKKTSKMSVWWEDYIQDPQPNNKQWAKEF